VVEAIRWTGENVKEVKEFAGSKAMIHYQYTAITPDVPNVVLVLDTYEGEMHASKGDYIIKGVDGEIYACKPWVFEKTYEVAE
jgi:hypothetical protein